MFNIKESTLAFFGSCIVQFQMNIISLEQLKTIFKIFGYELINDIGYGCNYFLVRDDNGNEYDIYYNEKLIELMAIYGDESAMKGMSAILDWERDFGYGSHKNWVNVDRKWVFTKKNI